MLSSYTSFYTFNTTNVYNPFSSLGMWQRLPGLLFYNPKVRFMSEITSTRSDNNIVFSSFSVRDLLAYTDKVILKYLFCPSSNLHRTPGIQRVGTLFRWVKRITNKWPFRRDGGDGRGKGFESRLLSRVRNKNRVVEKFRFVSSDLPKFCVSVDVVILFFRFSCKYRCQCRQEEVPIQVQT